MEKFELPQKLLNDLKCELCNEYLSYPPIMIHAVSGSVCGRCPNLEPEQNVTPLRESNYETLAKNFLLFPCRYKPQGCSISLPMQIVPKHEDLCIYKPLFCPFLPLGNCPWQGTPDESQMHFATDHPELFLESSVFELNIIDNYKRNMLMPKYDNFFLIHTEYVIEESTFYCSVYYIKDANNKKYKYSLEFHTSDGQNSQKLDDKDMHIYKVSMPKEEGFNINTLLLQEHLDHPMSITCSVQINEIEKSPEDQLVYSEESFINQEESEDDEEDAIIQAETDKMLIDIECPVCQEFMIPPIYQCQTGHSICGVCKPQLHECPSCRGPLGQTRNFTLEKLTEHIMYQCKNRLDGCKYKATSKVIKQHEKECKFTSKKCPFYEFEECEWRGVHRSVLAHVVADHAELFINKPYTLNIQYSYSNNTDEIEKITKVFGQLFRFRLAYTNENRKIYATVQYIGTSDEAEKYMYEVEVCDFSKKKLKCYSKKYCGAISDDKNDYNHCSIWTVDMITPFMSQNKNIQMIFNINKTQF